MYICTQITTNKNTDKMETLNDILDSKEFNEMFNFEQEQKELEEAGWTLKEVIDFANSIAAKK